jgi:hypothetical protein
MKAAIRMDVTNWRIETDLGRLPHTVQEFVPLWLGSRGYKMEFSGLWTQHGKHSPHDGDYIVKSMRLWAVEFGRFAEREAIAMAFDTWAVEEKVAVQNVASEALKFDAAADPEMVELKKFVGLIIAPGDSDHETFRVRKAAEIAFANLIFRIKNHLRYVWKNSCHLMIILSGCQGDGKTFAIEHLMSPLGDMFTPSSLDALKDNSMSYQFSVMPAMLFEEMQGSSKADIEELKSIMTGKSKMMREAYARAGVRRLVTTFIGAANKDIGNLIKDDTGNRRFIQFFSQKIDRDVMAQVDVMKIWRSVDEAAHEPPMYASHENYELIHGIQDEQRTLGPVEQWLLGATNVPWDHPAKANQMFDDFKTWCVANGAMSTSESHHWSGSRLGATLKELAQAKDRYTIKVTRTGGSDSFRIQRPQARVVTSLEQRRIQDGLTKADRLRLEGKIAAVAEAHRLAGEWEEVEAATDAHIEPSARLKKVLTIQTGKSWGSK